MLCLVVLLVVPGVLGVRPVAGSGQQVDLAFRIDVGFDIPESMQYDPSRDVYYVSNIGAHATRADNNGYISRVRPDGTLADARFIQGGRDGVTLNAPKGMRVEGDTLWVADVDHLRAFDLDTGRSLVEVDLSSVGARFLNDLDRGPDGALYVTDTGLDFDGPDFHPGPDRIYRVGLDRSVSVALDDPDLRGPNGILWDATTERFLVGSLLSDAVFGWRPGSSAEVVARGTGGYDGIARLPDGRVLVASQDGEAIQELLPDGTFREVVGGISSPGDIGVDHSRGRILVPRLDAQVVEVWTLGDSESNPGATRAGVESSGLQPELVADGLEVPWDMDFAPDGRIFLTERPGRIRIVHPVEGLLTAPWLQLDVARGGDGGLQGIALAPDFARSGHVYVMGTFPGESGDQESRILRFTDRGGRGVDRRAIFGPVPMAGVHRGGGLAFGPDGMLYASLGDARDLDAPQDPDQLRGSIIRLEPDGSIPSDGPRPGSPVFAIGVRNPQGLSFDPASGFLFGTDHGPSDFPGEHGWTGRDEVNAIVPGGNYGWPVVAGDTVMSPFIPPLVSWTPAIAPGGLAVQPFEGAGGPVLWIGGLRGERLLRVQLHGLRGGAEWEVHTVASYLDGVLGRIRAVGLSPDGMLYLGTSNLDADGDPDATSDRLFRLRLDRVETRPSRSGGSEDE